jgi:hypothetical protein
MRETTRNGFAARFQGGIIEGVLAEFRRRGVASKDAEIVLSVGAYRAADRRPVPFAAASMRQSDEVFAIPLVSFKDFQASLIDGTPMARTEIWALDGAQIFPDGSVKLAPQEGLPMGCWSAIFVS